MSATPFLFLSFLLPLVKERKNRCIGMFLFCFRSIFSISCMIRCYPRLRIYFQQSPTTSNKQYCSIAVAKYHNQKTETTKKKIRFFVKSTKNPVLTKAYHSPWPDNQHVFGNKNITCIIHIIRICSNVSFTSSNTCEINII